jgi:tRNA pseudouridine38-40 synthase
MPRYKLIIEYDGSDFCGWQRQDGCPSVQQHIEDAITRTMKTEVRLHVAGRTDAGVHAIAQCAHFDSDIERDPYRIMQGINQELYEVGAQIVVNEATRIADSDDFHARFSAERRHYLYRVINRQSRLCIERKRAWHVRAPLDCGAMREGATHLIGNHDFTTFRSTACQSKSPVKTLDRLDIIEQLTPFGREVHFIIDAQSFLHNQVRNMVGALVLVGQGKWTSDDIATARDTKDRRAGGPTAPAHGLYFMKVDYS